MFKINGKGAALLMLLGATVGSMAVTNASAMSKSTKKTLTRLEKREEKKTSSSKKIDKAFDAVGMKNLNALTLNSYDGELPDYNQENTFKLLEPLTISNEFRKKKVVLPAKTVINGNIDTLNFIGVNTLDLSKKNQKRVFKALGSKYSSGVSFSNKGNLDDRGRKIMKKYTRNTPFSRNGQRNLPDLYAKNLQSYYDGDRSNNPFITVTSDNYMNYYSKKYKKNAVANYSEISQSVKIKKLKRTGNGYTYYLAKPMKGFGTKRVVVANHYQYKLKVSLGHVFRSYDNYNLDPGGYRMTVKVGKRNFYVNLGNIAETYIGSVSGDKYATSAVSATLARQYIADLK